MEESNRRLSDVDVREAVQDEYAEIAAMHYTVWRESYSTILRDTELDGFSPSD